VFIAAGWVTAVAAQTPQVPQLPQIPNLPTNIPNAPNLQMGPPAPPKITSPKNGAAVGSPIVVKGTATHGVKVTVTATLTADVPISGMSTQLGGADTTADGKGNWQVSITPKIPVKISFSGVKIVLEAVATNPTTGQKSATTRIEVVPHS